MKHIIALLSLVLVIGCVRSHQADFYVRPDGDDSWDGRSVANAFQSLDAARRAVRAETSGGMTGDIWVHVGAGDYYLDSPAVFTAEDSGADGYKIYYESSDGPGRARFVGGRRLTGWVQHTATIWKVEVDELSGSDIFHTLYENGRRAGRARFPNYSFNPQYRSARGTYLTTDGSSDDGESPNWISDDPDKFLGAGDPRGWNMNLANPFKVNIFPDGGHDWHQVIVDMTGISFDNGRWKFELDTSIYMGADARYFIEGDLSFLDTPGEFYLDVQDSQPGVDYLYYMPYGGSNPNEQRVVMPTIRDMIRLEGASRQEADLVHDVVFDGLGFEATNAISPTPQWWGHDYGRTDHAVIWMTNTRNLEIKNCHLRNSGRNGIMMIGHNINNTVRGCWIEQMGVNAITLSNRFTDEAGGDINEGHTLTNNKIHDVGQLSLYAACVNVFNSSGNEISSSECYNSPRYAVTLRGDAPTGDSGFAEAHSSFPSSSNNRFRLLKIYDTGQDSGDLGAVHAAGVSLDDSRQNTFEQITVNNTGALPGLTDPWQPNGIFLDWPGTVVGQTFRNIEITNTQDDAWPLRANARPPFDSEEYPLNIHGSTFDNVSGYDRFVPSFMFDGSRMNYPEIGLTEEFPYEYLTLVDMKNFAGWGTDVSWSANTRTPYILDVDGDGDSDVFLQHADGDADSKIFIRSPVSDFTDLATWR